MSIQGVKVTKLTCDGCDRELLVEDWEDPIGWYQGEVLYFHGGGGSGGRWDACGSRCLKKAVIRGVERPEDGGT